MSEANFVVAYKVEVVQITRIFHEMSRLLHNSLVFSKECNTGGIAD